MEFTNEQKQRLILLLESEFRMNHDFLCNCVHHLYNWSQIDKEEFTFLTNEIKQGLKGNDSFESDGERYRFLFQRSNYYFDEHLKDLHNKNKVVIPKTTVLTRLDKQPQAKKESLIDYGLFVVIFLFLSFIAVFIYALNSI